MAEKYNSWSPYTYTLNNPVKYIDPDGREIKVSDTYLDYFWRNDGQGNWAFRDKQGNAYTGSNQFILNASQALTNLMNGGTVGKNLVSALASNKNRIVQLQGFIINAADKDGNYVYWKSQDTEGPIDVNGKRKRDVFISLGHELAHIIDQWDGTQNNDLWFTNPEGINIPKNEIFATHIENLIRAENNIPLREFYDIIDNSGAESILIDKTYSKYYDINEVPNYERILQNQVNPFKY